jgi:hypothetical protein
MGSKLTAGCASVQALNRIEEQGAEFTPEPREQEDRLRARIEGKG